MHRSRIGALFIDHPASSFDASLRFWAAATGREPNEERPAQSPYTSLGYFHGDLLVELQRTGEDTPPGGLVFCVIPPHTPDFAEQATVWE
jgi:hypothetical protein